MDEQGPMVIFIQMGSFILYDGNEAIGVLGPRQLKVLHAKGKIAIPLVKGV